MEGILNEVTNTVHKPKVGTIGSQTRCGATAHITHDNLRTTSIESTIDNTDTSKCGRCFEEGGGY